MDFTIQDGIIMECKAIELHPRSGILRNSDMLTKELKPSVVKAYTQMLTTAHLIDPNRQWFGSIITYLQTFIGFGTSACNEILATPATEFAQQHNLNINSLPPERFLFLVYLFKR